MFSSLFIVLLFYPSSHLSPSISLLPFSFIFRTRRSIAIILRFSCGYPRCHTVLRVSSVNILRLPIPWSRICFSLPLPSIFECIVDPSAHRSKVSLINRNRKEESIRGSTWKQLCLCSTTFMYKDIVRFSLRSDYAWPFSSFFFSFTARFVCVCVCMCVCVYFMGRFRCSCARFFSCSSFIYFFLIFFVFVFFFSFFFESRRVFTTVSVDGHERFHGMKAAVTHSPCILRSTSQPSAIGYSHIFRGTRERAPLCYTVRSVEHSAIFIFSVAQARNVDRLE